MESYSESYKKAGVDVTAGYKAVELMKSHIARTMTANVLTDIGGFGGLYALDVAGMQQPVLVSGTDGVGTKLKIAFLMDKHTTIGIDCVAMCVNDIICCGAKPQFFLDYIALGKNVPEKVASIVSGVAEGCVQSGCALVGGGLMREMVALTREKNIPWVTFGKRSKKGHPHHPLYLRKDSTPEPFDVENYLDTCF